MNIQVVKDSILLGPLEISEIQIPSDSNQVTHQNCKRDHFMIRYVWFDNTFVGIVQHIIIQENQVQQSCHSTLYPPPLAEA